MKMKFGLKQTAAFLLVAALVGALTGCGDSQSNAPLKSAGVELTDSSLSFDNTSLNISGTITTSYSQTGTAVLTNIVPEISGCTIQSYTIGTNNSVTYTDNSDVQAGVSISLSQPCTATSVTISGTEISDQNISWSFSASASVQAANPDAESSPIASITADVSSFDITLNSEQREVVLQVRDSNFVPISEGTVSVRYPSVLNAGIMNPIQEVDVLDGQAKFVYTAPSDISDMNGSSYEFGFFDTLNPLTSTSVTFTFNPDTTQIIQTEYIITSSVDDENVTMDLNKTRVLSFFLKDKEGNVVPDADVSSMSVTLLNTELADLIDSDGTVYDTTLSKTVNNVTISLASFNKSGLLPVEVVFNFTDVNGVAQTISRIISVVVLSGPPTAFSMSYAGTSQDKSIAKFIEHIVISAVDEYGNKVNRGSTISVGAISGYARDTTYAANDFANVVGNQYAVSLTPILDYAPVGTATIENSGSGAQLTSANIANTIIDLNNDKLTTFRSDLYDYPFHASGKWDMSAVAGSTIDLLDEYATTMPTESNMGYVIGHNYRQKICSTTGEKATAYVESGDGKYTLDAAGNAIVDVYYDYYLVGKTVAISSNLVTFVNGGSGDVRGGETLVHTFRGFGIEFDSTLNVPASTMTKSKTFGPIDVLGTDIAFQNSNFSFDDYSSTGDIVILEQVAEINGSYHYAYFDGTTWVADNDDNASTPSVIVSDSAVSFSHTSMEIGKTANSAAPGGWEYAPGYNSKYLIYNCDKDGNTYIKVWYMDMDKTNDTGGTVHVSVRQHVVSEY